MTGSQSSARNAAPVLSRASLNIRLVDRPQQGGANREKWITMCSEYKKKHKEHYEQVHSRRQQSDSVEGQNPAAPGTELHRLRASPEKCGHHQDQVAPSPPSLYNLCSRRCHCRHARNRLTSSSGPKFAQLHHGSPCKAACHP